jgi:hypothetical protein
MPLRPRVDADTPAKEQTRKRCEICPECSLMLQHLTQHVDSTKDMGRKQD